LKKTYVYITLAVLVVLYALVTVLAPRPLDWTVTLERADKNPYGAFIVYERMSDLFPGARISSEQLPAYNLLQDTSLKGTAYVVVSPGASLEPEDVYQLLGYVERGNDVFIAAGALSRALSDSLGVKLAAPRIGITDTLAHIGFTNPRLAADTGFALTPYSLDGYFSKVDTPTTVVLGETGRGQADFIRVRRGKGQLYLHAAPLCFSNYFILHGDNDAYASAALSYLSPDLTRVYWDEYYKLGSARKGSLLTFFLSDPVLRWAWWLALFALIAYVLFESKRRQRVIPVEELPRNTSLDFVRTVARLYYERHDNRHIADKKIAYFLEWVRGHLYLSTEKLDPAFAVALSRKSGAPESRARDLVELITQVRGSGVLSDALLLQLNTEIDAFYTHKF
jgi:hypothetical protein